MEIDASDAILGLLLVAITILGYMQAWSYEQYMAAIFGVLAVFGYGRAAYYYAKLKDALKVYQPKVPKAHED